MEAAGSDRLRLTAYQKLVVLDVPDDAVEPLLVDARAVRWRHAVDVPPAASPKPTATGPVDHAHGGRRPTVRA